MIAHYVVLMFGVICAGVGGELFVRGTVGLARWSRISPGIVAATVAAFATSSPELSVSISSAIAGKPPIALGDALGSNVVNVAFILGAALAISGIQASRAGVERDLPVALLVPTGLMLNSPIMVLTQWKVTSIITSHNDRALAATSLRYPLRLARCPSWQRTPIDTRTPI